MDEPQPEPMTDSELRRLMVRITVMILLLVGSLVFCVHGMKDKKPPFDLDWSAPTYYLLQAACWALAAVIMWPRMWPVGLIAGPVAGAGALFVGVNANVSSMILGFLLMCLGAAPGIALYYGLLKLFITSGWIDPFPEMDAAPTSDTNEDTMS